MSTAVELPALGESVIEGVLSRWLVKEGDRVDRDQPLVEVTTDKVDAEIPAPHAGVVAEVLVAEGETVPVGTALLRLEPIGAPVSPPPPLPPHDDDAAPATRATPLARRLAGERGVDLAEVAGTGRSGRVTREDLDRHAAAEPVAAPAAKPAAAPAPDASALAPGDRVIPMSPLRKLVAEHMQTSKRVSPHVGTVTEIDLSAVMRARAERGAAVGSARGRAPSVLSFVVHASVRALREYPALNASVVGENIVEKGDVHLGIAVETEKGLIVPVIRHADRLSLTGIADTIQDLAERARSRRIAPDELRGGTFTLSNPGREGNLYGFAIIHQPQVGILRMGEIAKRAVVRTVDGEDVIAIRPTMHLALSYDHRAVDGAPANAFLARIRALLEEGDFAS